MNGLNGSKHASKNLITTVLLLLKKERIHELSIRESIS